MLKRVLPFFILLLAATASLAQQPRTSIEGDHLLTIAWGGSVPYNALVPAGDTLGCHSVAIAQIMYYHRLAPHGEVAYQCSSGTTISEGFSDYTPQWDRFSLHFDPEQDNAGPETHATARFIYAIASVIRKDFGTDQYVDYPDDCHKLAIESHFRATLTPYIKEVTTSIDNALKTDIDSYDLMKSEIDSGRPVGFYYSDQEGGGHAVVIDGYTVKDGKTYFHANFGWLGRSDGWYLLAEDLPGNTKEMIVITIVPKETDTNAADPTERIMQ